ncbi:hypothetical protein Ab1vBOLIVR2_gp06 [Agrobacterium phage OLIVR2]|uniref:Uncharacterized protein n=1 Tax=Agrobacterium phage OLIVR1 TaxID=2723769 RepID=A0A858MSC2_9CAUD|nr:hypothetical protein KNU98_gp103 [Agrobacterium phage OLIVR1]QIW87201.1 hypothetical protein Ab1vBOLIVR1_gp06 [Agrobacterium phage OLIVR1]QIW87309.1 hypothetical protein Ab1vBOLIVR2_gp06 [Agrobacterium phage OLIVR2]QIW87416.1 hypothetical protein Ab1vBOLIVR3_gp06 [Agrobacterium phage OLIVR3]
MISAGGCLLVDAWVHTPCYVGSIPTPPVYNLIR